MFRFLISKLNCLKKKESVRIRRIQMAMTKQTTHLTKLFLVHQDGALQKAKSASPKFSWVDLDAVLSKLNMRHESA
ncbi:hypothetical protein BgiMline_032171 [Biomphalaria glabrata]